MTTMGQGKEMHTAPCTPRAYKASSHTAERCRCRPSGPGATLCVHAGSGCLEARLTRTRDGSRWAVPRSSRDGMGTTTSRTACPALELASLWPPAVRAERREASLCSLPSSLGARQQPVPRRSPAWAPADGAGP